MDKNQLKEMIAKKIPIEESEWEQVIVEAEKESKEMGVSDEDREKDVCNKIFAKFRKKLMNPAFLCEGIILGVSDITDFGAQKKYDELKEQYNLGDEGIKQSMINSGMIDSEGNPLWFEGNCNVEWKYKDKDGNLKSASQRKINPKLEQSRQAIGLLRVKDDKNNIGYKKAFISIQSNKIDMEIPEHKKIEINLAGKFDEERDCYFLRTTSTSYAKIVKEEKISQKEYEDILDKYFTNEIFDLSKSEDISKLSSINEKNLVFLKNGVVITVFPTDEGKNNIVGVGSIALGFDEEGIITCFVPENLPLPPEGTSDLIISGRPSISDNRIIINVLNIFSKHEFIKPEKIEPEPISVEKSQPTNDESW